MGGGDIQLKMDEMGRAYLQYNERATKTRTGETTSTHQRAFQPKQFAHDKKENCPVHVYKTFRSQRPDSMCFDEAPFYLAINHNRRSASKWYKSQALGENTPVPS